MSGNRTEDAYTMAEVVDILDCCEDVVLERIQRGELAAEKFGRGWVFPREAFRESINAIARDAAERRRAEHAAKRETKAVLTQAKKTRARRGRVPPALPSLS